MSQSNIYSGIPYNFAQGVPGSLAQLLASQPVAQNAPQAASQPAPAPVPTAAIATPPPGYQPPVQMPNNGSPLQSEFYKFLTGATNGLPGNPQPPMQQTAPQPRPLTAPSTPPGAPHPDANKFAALIQQPTLAINQSPTATFNGPSLPTPPGATPVQPNVATGQTANLNIDGTPNMDVQAGTPMAKTATASKPNFGQELLSGLGRFAPAALIALASRGNPGAGAALLGGIERGQERMTAQRQFAQQTADARAQQTFDNNLETAKVAATQQNNAILAEVRQQNANTAAGRLTSTNIDNLRKTAAGFPDAKSAYAFLQAADPNDDARLQGEYNGLDPNAANPIWNKQESGSTAATVAADAPSKAATVRNLEATTQSTIAGIPNKEAQTAHTQAETAETTEQTKHIDAETDLTKATTAELPEKMSIALQHLGIDANSLNLREDQWSVSHLNPKSQYFDPTATDTKEVIALTTKAQAASNRISSIQRDADKLYTTIQSEGKNDPSYAGDVAELADYHRQIADGNAQVAGWNGMIKSIANAAPNAPSIADITPLTTNGSAVRTTSRQTPRSIRGNPNKGGASASKGLDLSKFMR